MKKNKEKENGGFFVGTRFDVLDNKSYRELMTSHKGIELTYHWLRRNIVRAPMKTKHMNEVHQRYFLKGKLAASIPQEKFAEAICISRDTLTTNLDMLKEAEIITEEELKTRKRKGAQKAQKVYILGNWKTYWNENINEEDYAEFYLVNDKFRIQKSFLYEE